MPKRIQRKRTKGWRIPEGAVNVCRPTIWGNPFVHNDAAQAVEAYRKLVNGGSVLLEFGPGKLHYARRFHPNTLHWAYSNYVRDHIHELRGKDLVCFCALDKPCHADVLLELANPTPAAP